ncbi:uncharacterized protein PADG_04327 [Paracoccidioides brasiliensis Pb18]|uniref:Major facilitator superfamily (MFS) profile domain-containing protein n=1 Tax=Paracoccidioides brasiliensis (strain Pb18) TaxID=502780 RepID=C1GAP1_PARBD|nr:uncharacterized protein PADG_04327 [Paracoccidioides brasiliensis Pb18]EEH48243.2 hypothetical protein PADG_04327 [Paracoccidioides brasiliensis Pb18]
MNNPQQADTAHANRCRRLWRWWGNNNKPPRLLQFRSSKPFILWVCAFSVFSDIFLYGLIVPVMPFALSDRIGVEPGDAQKWTSILLTVYAAALLVGSPICGWWADKSNTRQVPFMFGLLLLAGATLMLALARTLTLLVVARILQGLSGSIVWVIALAMLADRVGSKEIGAHIGTIVLARSIATIAAPLIGGVVYAKVGYYMVYVTAFIFLGADIVFRLAMIEARVARKWDPSIGLPAPQEDSVVEKSEGSEKAASTPRDDCFSINMQPRKGRIYHPVHYLPPFIVMLGSIRLLLALWGCIVIAILFGAFEAVIPLFVEAMFNWDSFGAGLVFLALLIPTFISPAIGRLADKHGPRWYVAVGYVLTMIPVVLLRIVTRNTLHDKVVFCVLLAFCGAFCMFFEVPIHVEIMLSVEEKMRQNPKYYGEKGAYAQAFGLGNLMYALGLIVGPLWGGYVVESAGWEVMTLSLGVMCCAGAVPAAICTGGNIFTIKKDRSSEVKGQEEPQRVSLSVEEALPTPSSVQKPDSDAIRVYSSAV